MLQSVQIKRIGLGDADTLLQLSRQTFFDAFLHLNHSGDMDAYAATAFTPEKFKQELNDPNSHFYFALIEGVVAGYLKLNYNDAQTELQDPQAVEVERIYDLADYQGKQIGRQMLEFTIGQAIESNLKYVWLGVWEHNAGAIRFYKSKGFEQFGSHPFLLGNDRQTDILMKLVLNKN